jgi:predicted neutral ceramidase superfamily lipid hydrolase
MTKEERSLAARTANVERRSNMEVAIDSRLLGVAITIFILILTIKIELLSYTIMTAQLILSMPFLMAAMISNSKIVNQRTLKSYHIINRITSAVAIAFLFNTLGLMVAKYISFVIGIIFFVIFIILLIFLMFIDLDKSTVTNKMMTEILMIFLMVFLGLLPALGYYGI